VAHGGSTLPLEHETNAPVRAIAAAAIWGCGAQALDGFDVN
jgi:hypothetical protein